MLSINQWLAIVAGWLHWLPPGAAARCRTHWRRATTANATLSNRQRELKYTLRGLGFRGVRLEALVADASASVDVLLTVGDKHTAGACSFSLCSLCNDMQYVYEMMRRMA